MSLCNGILPKDVDVAVQMHLGLKNQIQPPKGLDAVMRQIPEEEGEINQIAGVVTVGLFARRPADVLLVGTPSGVVTLTA